MEISKYMQKWREQYNEPLGKHHEASTITLEGLCGATTWFELSFNQGTGCCMESSWWGGREEAGRPGQRRVRGPAGDDGRGLAWSQRDGKACRVGLVGPPGERDAEWAAGGRWDQTPPCTWPLRSLKPVWSLICSVPSPCLLQFLEVYLLSLCGLAELVHKLAHGHQHRQDQPGG